MQIPHSQPTLNSTAIKTIGQAITSSQVAQGKHVKAFEQRISTSHKAKGAVAVNSGTSALHLALLALEIKKSDEVILPTFVCTALLNAVNMIGAKARLVDVDKDTFNISVAEVKKKITKKTKAVIVPHMFGQPANLKALRRLGIPIVEDCAQSIGARYQGKPVGSSGQLSIFSFYATKVLTTGEGGMVIAKQRNLIDLIKDLRDYDNKDDYKLRFNYKMTELQAALGLAQLKKLSTFIKKRKAIAKIYDQKLSGLDLSLPVKEKGNDHIYFRYVVKIAKNKNKFINYLKRKGISSAGPVYKPLHQYLKIKGFPIADKLMREAVSIPIYPTLIQKQQRYIIQTIHNYFR